MPIYYNGILNGLKALQISCGLYHTCAIYDDNKIYCWGYNSLKLLLFFNFMFNFSKFWANWRFEH
jgi:hypothetical protein